MEAKDVLVGAKGYIMEHGWCQNVFFSDTGAVCVSGALARVYGDAGDLEAQEGKHASEWGIVKAENYFKEAVESNSIPRWNDDPERQEYEVLYALDYAARLAGGK